MVFLWATGSLNVTLCFLLTLVLDILRFWSDGLIGGCWLIRGLPINVVRNLLRRFMAGSRLCKRVFYILII